MVTTASGKNQAFYVHRGVLGKSSAFFQRALKPEWAVLRDQPDVIQLSEESIQAVKDYFSWLYTDSMPIQLYQYNSRNAGREQIAEAAEKVFVELAEAYVLAERIIDVGYKNAVLKTIIAAKKSSTWNMGPESVKIVYKGTPPTSPLRRLIANSIASWADDDSNLGYGWMAFFDAYPKDALVDALKATVKARPKLKCNLHDDVSLYLEEEKIGGETEKTD